MKNKSLLIISLLTIAFVTQSMICNTQKEVIETESLSVSFNADKDEIETGKTTFLRWKSNADSIFFKGNDEKLFMNGSKEIRPEVTKTYHLSAYKNGINKTISITINVTEPEPENVTEQKRYANLSSIRKNHIYSQGQDDGRFTIGSTDGKRLMYGYPIPNSTSHIILKVDDAFASNYPNFATENDTVYFSGKQKITNNKGSIKTEITMMLDSVFITQTLQAVDKNLKPVKPETFGQYYLISYKIENLSLKNKQVGFMTLLDLMIDDNDAAETYFNNKLINNEQGFTGINIPERFKTLHVKGELNGFASETILENGNVHKPDFLYVGQWSPFHGYVWDVNTDKEPFSDSGYLLKWNDKNISAGDSVTYSYYYGLPFNGEIRAVPHNKNVKTKSVTIYYKGIGSSKLNKNAKHSLDSLLEGHNDFYGGIIKGYGDATGTDAQNLKISEKRIKNIIKYLTIKGIEKNTLIPKPYGESTALHNEDTEKNGNLFDRKATVILYIE